MTPREWLECALTEFRSRPWVCGVAYRDTDGAVCAEGALQLVRVGLTRTTNGRILNTLSAADPEPEWWHAYTALRHVVREATGRYGLSVSAYNDHIAASKDEMIAFYEKAIAQCD